MPVRKQRQIGLRVLDFARLLVRSKWHHGREGVNRRGGAWGWSHIHAPCGLLHTCMIHAYELTFIQFHIIFLLSSIKNYTIANNCNILNFNAFCFSHQISMWKWNGSSRAGVRRQETAQQPVLFVCKTVVILILRQKLKKKKKLRKKERERQVNHWILSQWSC